MTRRAPLRDKSMIEAGRPSPGLHGPAPVHDPLAFERLLSELSARFIDLPTAEIDSVIEDGLRRVVEALDLDRSTLTRLAPDGGQLHSTHSWATEGVPPTPTTPWPRVAFSWLISMGRAGKPVVFSSLSELPPAASAERLAYQGIGIRSHVAQPMIVGGELIGFLGFGSMRRERAWPEDLVARMRALADIFASALARQATERRKQAAEQEAAHWRERLAHLVRVHTVGEMSAALAHEITQPLGAIENYALAARRRAAEASPDLAKIVDLLDKVIGQATRAGDVVMRLRGLVKRHDLELKEIEVEGTVRACIDMVKTDCEFRDIRIELKPAAGVPAVVADEIHIQQVILNLLRNAMEAMEQRSDLPRVITVETGLGGSDAVSVRVADRGPGIPDGDLERVFESFFSTKPSGLGIGLAICRKLIEAHGGTLRASHNPGGGAVFQFTLPARAPGA